MQSDFNCTSESVLQAQCGIDRKTIESDDLFCTDHLIPDMKARSLQGGAVTILAQGVVFCLQMGSTMILARVLTPEDFGLIAMVSAAIGFLTMFGDGGLSMATVHRKTVTHEQISVLFWVNVLLGVILFGIVGIASPVIAWFYGDPRLVWIALALSSTFIFYGLTVQHQALLNRKMGFSALAFIDIFSKALGVVVGVALALVGCGYWALVAMTICSAIVNCIFIVIVSGWWPGLPRRGTGVRPMLRFGGGVMGFAIFNYLIRNSDNAIIGAALGSKSLGIYSKAYGLLLLPINQINAPLTRVAVPVLSRLRDEPERFRRYYLSAISVLAFVSMPIVAFLFSDTKHFVLTVLGPQWLDSVPVFMYLAPAAFLGALNVAPGWLCVSLGSIRKQFIWAMVSAPILVFAYLIGVQFGIGGVAIAFSLSWSGLYLIFLAYACHNSPVRLSDIAWAVGPTALSAILASAVVFLLNTVIDFSAWNPFGVLCLLGTIYAAVYLSSWWLFCDTSSIVNLVRARLEQIQIGRRANASSPQVGE